MPATFARILCPVDFSDPSMHGVDHAVAIAGWSAAELTLLNVRPPAIAQVADLPVPDLAGPAADLQRAQDQMGECLQSARTAGVRAAVLIDVGQAAADILSQLLFLPKECGISRQARAPSI